jgi:hypothetical protein
MSSLFSAFTGDAEAPPPQEEAPSLLAGASVTGCICALCALHAARIRLHSAKP